MLFHFIIIINKSLRVISNFKFFFFQKREETETHCTMCKNSLKFVIGQKKTEKISTLTASSTGIELSKELIFQIYIKIDVDFQKIIDSMTNLYLLKISDPKLGVVQKKGPPPYQPEIFNWTYTIFLFLPECEEKCCFSMRIQKINGLEKSTCQSLLEKKNLKQQHNKNYFLATIN